MLSTAPAIDITTPFAIDDNILAGFDYTITPIEYIRYGIGEIINPNTYNRGAYFEQYNETIKDIARDINIKLISFNTITINEKQRGFFSFLITINHYTITPKETLTAEQEWRFSNELSKLLESIKEHPLKPFFVCENMRSHPDSDRSILFHDIEIQLPDIYIWVNEYLTDEDELKIVRYIDQRSAFYRDAYISSNIKPPI